MTTLDKESDGNQFHVLNELFEADFYEVNQEEDVGLNNSMAVSEVLPKKGAVPVKFTTKNMRTTMGGVSKVNVGKVKGVVSGPKTGPKFSNGILSPVSNNMALAVVKTVFNNSKTTPGSSSKVNAGPHRAAEADYHVLVRGNNKNNEITKVMISNSGVGSGDGVLDPTLPLLDNFENPTAPYPSSPIDGVLPGMNMASATQYVPGSEDGNDVDIVSSSEEGTRDTFGDDGVNDIESFSQDMVTSREEAPRST